MKVSHLSEKRQQDNAGPRAVTTGCDNEEIVFGGNGRQ